MTRPHCDAAFASTRLLGSNPRPAPLSPPLTLESNAAGRRTARSPCKQTSCCSCALAALWSLHTGAFAHCAGCLCAWLVSFRSDRVALFFHITPPSALHRHAVVQRARDAAAARRDGRGRVGSGRSVACRSHDDAAAAAVRAHGARAIAAAASATAARSHLLLAANHAAVLRCKKQSNGHQHTCRGQWALRTAAAVKGGRLGAA